MPEIETYKLEDLGFLGRGKSKHRPRNDPSLYGGKYPFIQTGEVKAAEFYLNSFEETYNEKGLAQSKLWEPGTLLITIAANIAETAILDIKACFPDSILGFIPDKDKADVRYIKYYIDTIKMKMQNISKGTTQDNLSLEKLRSIDFEVPPLESQQKIASILSAFDDLIENNNRRIAILEEMARLIYREWFVRYRYPGHEKGKMVDSGTEFGEVPEGWGVKKLEDFGRIETGKTPPKKDPENYGDYMPFIKTPDMHDQLFILETTEQLSKKGADTQKKKTLPPKSICISCIGTAGIVAINSILSQTNQQINSIILENRSDLEFLYYAVKDLKPTMEKVGSSGATMTNVSKGKFQSLKVVAPTNSLVECYHKKVESMFDQILTLQKQNLKLKATRDLLLPMLISGKILKN